MKRSVVMVILLLFAAAGVCLALEDASGQEGGLLTGDNLFDMFKKGGGLMYPILLCSVVALAFIFERFVTLRRSAVFPSAFFRGVTVCQCR